MVTLVVAVIGIFFAGSIIFLIRRDKLHVKHGLGWMLLALSLVLICLVPMFIDWLASHVDISYPPILAVMLVFVGIGIKLLNVDIEQSKIELRHQRTVQRLAILEAELLDIKNQSERSPKFDDQEESSK